MKKKAAPPCLSAKNAKLLWNPNVPWSTPPRGGEKGAVLITSQDDHLDDRYGCSGLGLFAHVQKMDRAELIGYVFIEAMHLIIRDGIAPLDVHREFLKLEEYQEGLAEDMLWDDPR